MSASQSRNLPEPLTRSEAAYRDVSGQLLPVTVETLARRAVHFAAGVRLGLNEPQGMRRLQLLTDGLHDVPSLSALLPRILDGVLSLTGADFGNIQLRDPVTGSLRIVTQSGFDSGFLDYFAVVEDDHSACGRAARDGAQIVIPDVITDPVFAPHREIAAASGFRAVQSTPLVDLAGRLVGMVSTHFRRPHRPAGLDLRIMEFYADAAGRAIASHLGLSGDGGLVDPVGREMISALLDRGNGRLSGPIAPPSAGADRDRRERVLLQAGDSAEDALPELAAYVVNRLFSIGLSLDSARAIVGDGPAGKRIAAATDEVDRIIRDIRTTVLRLTADPPVVVNECAARIAGSS